MAEILTLMFDNSREVVLQYHPNILSQSIQSSSRNVSGLDRTITYVAPSETWQNTVNISAYMTIIIPNEDDKAKLGRSEFGLAERGVATGVATGVSLAGLAGGEVLEVLEATFNTISIAKGAIDLVAGTIQGNNAFILPNPFRAQTMMSNLSTLSFALKQSMPCKITWDIDNSVNVDQKYIISTMGISTEKIQEESGETLVVKIDLKLIKSGTQVKII